MLLEMDRGSPGRSFPRRSARGRGDRVCVYRARDLSSGAAVLLAVLRREAARSPGEAERFLKAGEEASARRPGIAPVLALGRDAGRCYAARPFGGGLLETALR